jgi:hypothetical protein
MAVMRVSSLALPMGTKGWPRRSRTDPRCGVATAKEITYGHLEKYSLEAG